MKFYNQLFCCARLVIEWIYKVRISISLIYHLQEAIKNWYISSPIQHIANLFMVKVNILYKNWQNPFTKFFSIEYIIRNFEALYFLQSLLATIRLEKWNSRQGSCQLNFGFVAQFLNIMSCWRVKKTLLKCFNIVAKDRKKMGKIFPVF